MQVNLFSSECFLYYFCKIIPRHISQTDQCGILKFPYTFLHSMVWLMPSIIPNTVRHLFWIMYPSMYLVGCIIQKRSDSFFLSKVISQIFLLILDHCMPTVYRKVPLSMYDSIILLFLAFEWLQLCTTIS